MGYTTRKVYTKIHFTLSSAFRIVYNVLEGVVTRVAETVLSNVLLGRSIDSRIDVHNVANVMAKVEEAFNAYEGD